jgi:molecular chaperone Hsp33
VTGTDRLRRFLFEVAPLRGHWVCLDQAWHEAREHQALPPPVRDLLGEALAAAALLAGSLKFEGTLTLQLRGGGRVSMLVAQATSSLTLRGVAHVRDGDLDAASDAAPDANMAPGSTDADFPALVGDGQLVITVEQGGAQAWQGIVPLDGADLATCLERYFEVSEQLPTRVVLAADERRAAGVLLQKLPGPSGSGEAGDALRQQTWEEAGLLLSTLRREELLAADAQPLLQRVFAGHDLRLFDGDAVRFACRCSRERVARMLESLGREEVEGILAEQGEVTVTCEFCKKPYRFDAVDAVQLFAGDPGSAVDPGRPGSVN